MKMQTQTLRSVLEHEHRDIDAAIEPVVDGDAVSVERRTALLRAVEVLRRHIYAEEELLFPSLRDAGMVGPVMVMLREHGQMWETLEAIERHLDAADGELSALCRDLLTQLQAHNSKEETILYPQADGVLSADTASHLRAFLEAGELPTGWTCHHFQV